MEICSTIIKYLSHPNLIIFMTADEELFYDVILNSMTHKMKGVLKYMDSDDPVNYNLFENSFERVPKVGKYNDKIQETASLYMRKIMPVSSRYPLKTFEDCAQKRMFCLDGEDTSGKADQSLEEFLKEIIDKFIIEVSDNVENKEKNFLYYNDGDDNNFISIYLMFLGTTSRQITDGSLVIQQFLKKLSAMGKTDKKGARTSNSLYKKERLKEYVREFVVDIMQTIGDMCWLQYSETGTKSWNMDHITLKQKRMKDSAVALEELRGEIDFLDKYVVGIDTASVENKAEPWIFAPVYLAIRRQIITKPIRQEKNRYSRINNIGLTYHVGEEFRHILSGFRHIYETISFMGFKAGDRIGHGIALGEDIERWVDRHETIVIPIEEWLENLVWLWGTSISGELNVNIFAEQLKEKIQILASEIYGNDTNLTPDILYEAYLEKFHLLHEKSFEMMKQYCQRDMLEEDGEHFCKYYKGRSNEEHRWTTEKLVCAYFCPVYYRRMQQPIMVHVERENLSLYLKIQEELLRIVAQKGIFVEVNPTSNTAIGENRELFMHHIMNLNNHGLVNEHAHEVMVTINSDDPLIFSTNCENELGYMYHALLSKGYSRERVIEWIDKIRQYGVDSSFVREIRPRNTLLNEIGQILQQIEKIVGVD